MSDIEPMIEPRDRLLLAAEELFASVGYGSTSVREICEQAHTNIAAVNYYFGSKERLYIETVKSAHACSMAQNESMEWPKGMTAVVKLERFIEILTGQMHGPIRASALQLVMRELTNPSDATREVVQEYISPMAHGLVAILDELLPELEARQRLMIGFSIVGQCLYYRQNRQVSEMLFGQERFDELTLPLVSEHIVRFTMGALGHGSGYGKPKSKRGTKS